MKNPKGWILFDGECPLCTSVAGRFAPWLHRHGFALCPLQTPWVKDKLAGTGELLSEMRLLLPDGTVYGGAAALVQLARKIWWARPLYWATCLPGAMAVLGKLYRWLARRRHCFGGGCPVPKRKKVKRVFFEMP